MPNERPGLFAVIQFSRVLLAVAGGYALAYGTVALLTRLLALAMPRGEAFVLAAMLGFLVYLTILVWAFADRNLARLAVAIPLGAIGTYGLAHSIGG